jgi:hypothetical protein
VDLVRREPRAAASPVPSQFAHSLRSRALAFVTGAPQGRGSTAMRSIVE